MSKIKKKSIKFLPQLKNCIDISDHLQWCKYENKYGFNFDKYNITNVMKDLINNKVTKSNQIASFIRQLNYYEFKCIKNVKKPNEIIYIHKQIKKIVNENKNVEFSIYDIKRKKCLKRKRKRKRYENNKKYIIKKTKNNYDWVDEIIDLINEGYDSDNFINNINYSNSDNNSNNEINYNEFKLEPLVVPDD